MGISQEEYNTIEEILEEGIKCTCNCDACIGYDCDNCSCLDCVCTGCSCSISEKVDSTQ